MNKLKEWLARLLYALPGKKYILLESNPPLEDNVGAVYRRMREDGWDKRYKLAWVLSRGDTIGAQGSDMTILRTDTVWNTIRFAVANCRAAAILDCNRQIRKLCPKTVHVFLTHGSPIKSFGAYYRCDPTTDHVLNQAPFFEEINARELHIEKEKLVTLGYPRNDLLFSKKADLKAYFGETYEKFVVWYPTFRQHRSGDHGKGIPGHYESGAVTIPVIETPEGAEAVNRAAQRHGVLVIVKPHPAQDLSVVREHPMSHIRFIDDSFYTEYGLAAYEFVGACDGLITDYSSVLFDYLLTDKPIGLTWQDVEAYKQTPGVVLDMECLRPCGEMLDTPEDFDRFFTSVATGDDPHAEGRERLKTLTNRYTDDRSAERFLAYLTELLS